MNGKGVGILLGSVVAIGGLAFVGFRALAPSGPSDDELSKIVGEAKQLGVPTSLKEHSAKYPRRATWAPLGSDFNTTEDALDQQLAKLAPKAAIRRYQSKSAAFKEIESAIANNDWLETELTPMGVSGTEYLDLRFYARCQGVVAVAQAKLGNREAAFKHIKRMDQAIQMLRNTPTSLVQIVAVTIEQFKVLRLAEVLSAQASHSSWVRQVLATMPKQEKNAIAMSQLHSHGFEVIDFYRNMHKYGGFEKLYPVMTDPTSFNQEIPPKAVTHTHEGMPVAVEGKVCLKLSYSKLVSALQLLRQGRIVSEAAQVYGNLNKEFETSSDRIFKFTFADSGSLQQRLLVAGQVQDFNLVLRSVCDFLTSVPASQQQAKAKSFFASRVCTSHGKPLKCQWSKQSLKVWSVGRNGVDDRGDPKSFNDVVITVRIRR